MTLRKVKKGGAMGLYAGMDLHSQNTFIGIMEKGSMQRVDQKRMQNDLPHILYELEPFWYVMAVGGPTTTPLKVFGRECRVESF